MSEVLEFNRSEPLTLGVELELQLLTTRDYDLTRGASDLLHSMNYDGSNGDIKLEITESMIEINTLARASVDEIAADLDAFRELPAVPLEPYPQRFYDEGTSVLLSPWRQSKSDPTAGHKTLGYMIRLLALRRAQQVSMIESLWFTTENLLAEGCISNVFVVKGGVVRTPPVDTPVLPGVTRATLIEVARAGGVTVEERSLTINDLLEADEVFLTSTSMEVMPVCRVEKHTIANDKPGPVSMRLLQLFRAQAAKECPA